MNSDKLKKSLARFGNPLVVKEGIVFTIFITGNGLSKWETVKELQKIALYYSEDKYPNIEAMVNDDNFFLLILKPNS
ncbi:MAG: hypothetical protein ACTHLE_04280 [Agriterribacter sp.]